MHGQQGEQSQLPTAPHVYALMCVCVCVCHHPSQEGELRPQLLDRFGLSVNVKTLQDKAQRTQLVLDRIAYEGNPDAFVDSAQAEQKKLQVGWMWTHTHTHIHIHIHTPCKVPVLPALVVCVCA